MCFGGTVRWAFLKVGLGVPLGFVVFGVSVHWSLKGSSIVSGTAVDVGEERLQLLWLRVVKFFFSGVKSPGGNPVVVRACQIWFVLGHQVASHVRIEYPCTKAIVTPPPTKADKRKRCDRSRFGFSSGLRVVDTPTAALLLCTSIAHGRYSGTSLLVCDAWDGERRYKTATHLQVIPPNGAKDVYPLNARKLLDSEFTDSTDAQCVWPRCVVPRLHGLCLKLCSWCCVGPAPEQACSFAYSLMYRHGDVVIGPLVEAFWLEESLASLLNTRSTDLSYEQVSNMP